MWVTQDFTPSSPFPERALRDLIACRNVCLKLGFIGYDPNRYKGTPFGNLSKRSPNSSDGCIITGTGTSQIPEINEEHFTLAFNYDPKTHSVQVRGPLKTSVETPSHLALYSLDQRIGGIVHSHCPEIWGKTKEMFIPTIEETVDYGSPEMFLAIQGKYRLTRTSDMKILSMGPGHQDGILAWGSTIEDAVQRTIMYYLRAKSL